MSDNPLDIPFFEACLQNPPDRQELSRLLAAGANPDATGPHELYGAITALMALILKRDPDADPADVRWLLEQGADPNLRADPPHGQTPLIYAASYGLPEICQALLDHGADPNAAAQDYYKPNALQASILGILEPERAATQRVLLEAGADPNAFGPHGQNAVIHAVRKQDSVALGLLLDFGGHLDGFSPSTELYNRETPLTAAFTGGLHPRTLAVLLERGANPNALDGRGALPLRCAAFTHSVEALDALLRHGADVLARNTTGESALRSYVAWAHAKLEVVEALLDRGADPNAADDHGVTPLMAATAARRADVTALLLARGADPAPADAEGRTALAIAEADGLDLIAAQLRGERPRLDRRDPIGVAFEQIREGRTLSWDGGVLSFRHDGFHLQDTVHAYRSRSLPPEGARELLAELAFAASPALLTFLEPAMTEAGLPPWTPDELAACARSHDPTLTRRMAIPPSPALAAEAILDALDTGREISRTDREAAQGYFKKGDLYVQYHQEHQGGGFEDALDRDAMRQRLIRAWSRNDGSLDTDFDRGAFLRDALRALGFETLRLYADARQATA